MNIEEKKKLLEGFCENRDDCVSCPLKDELNIDCYDFFECSDDDIEKAFNLVFGDEKMTLREFVKKYHPNMVCESCDGGVVGCPNLYKELGNRFNMCEGYDFSSDLCEKCWSQEYKPQVTQHKEEINHPDRYAGGKYECIKVMVDVFGADAVKHFCILNAFKYVWRFEHKNGVEDIKKAIWYLNEYVKLDEGYYDELGGDENA